MMLSQTLSPIPTLTLHRCPTDPPTYETPDGRHIVAYEPGAGWTITTHQVPIGGPVWFVGPQAAARSLAARLTRYTYDPALGEQCAVCGQARGRDTMRLGWWWHTACRATTDPDGAAAHNAPPTHDQEANRP